MKNFLTVTCIILTLSLQTFADDTTSEPCANGAGTVFIGKVTGHKYCLSNNSMNWWNAYSWCDGMGKQLINLNDCATTTSGKCPEMVGIHAGHQMLWTMTPAENNKWYTIEHVSGAVYTKYEPHHLIWHAVCK